MRNRFVGHLAQAAAIVLLACGVASAQGARPSLSMLTVTSTSFPDGGEIPAKYAGGQGVSPQLSWTGAPANTAAYVLVMHDVDVAIPAGNVAGDITHWVVWNIPASATSLPEAGRIPQQRSEAFTERRRACGSPSARDSVLPGTGRTPSGWRRSGRLTSEPRASRRCAGRTDQREGVRSRRPGL